MLNKLNNTISNVKGNVQDKAFNTKYDIKNKIFEAKINYAVMDKKEAAKKTAKIVTGAAAISSVIRNLKHNK